MLITQLLNKKMMEVMIRRGKYLVVNHLIFIKSNWIANKGL